ncbi:MAG: hypothetical protein N3E36_00555 [Sulfolobales archaeon]|nr:hypothetical protein [Sulfolobales archaeon]
MKVAAVLTLILLSIGLLQHSVQAEQLSKSTDCSFLLIILDKVLKQAIELDVGGLWLSKALYNASIQSGFTEVHREVYGALIDYFKTIDVIAKPLEDRNNVSEIILLLNRVESKLSNSLSKYINALFQCIHEPLEAASLKAMVSLKADELLNNVIPRLLNNITLLLYAEANLDIVLNKEKYMPGEEVTIFLKPLRQDIAFNKVRIAAWPSLRVITDLNVARYNETHYLSLYETPTLTKIYEQELTVIKGIGESVVQLAVVVVARSMNGSFMALKPFTVAYRTPSIKLSMPSRVYLGDVVVINISSDDFYYGELRINNVNILNVTLKPGFNSFTINLSDYNVSVGISTLELFVESTDYTLSYRAMASFLVEAKVPRIEVVLPNVILTSRGLTSLIIINRETWNLPIKVHVRVNGRKVVEEELKEELFLRVFTTMLPISTINVEVVAESPGHQPYVYEAAVLTINMLSTLATGLGIVLLTASLFRSERGFMIVLQELIERGKRRRAARIIKTILELPYSISSQIAELYYNLLRKLKQPHPELHETLREHYARMTLAKKLKNYLWRLLLLVERDLYSKKKPFYEEALEIAKEAEHIED